VHLAPPLVSGWRADFRGGINVIQPSFDARGRLCDNRAVEGTKIGAERADASPSSPSPGLEKIAGLLIPHLGETMARASVDRHLEKLGVPRDRVGPEHFQALVERLGQGLNVFLGRARASALVEAMHQALRDEARG
jgi:hypothetical protein